eukprot:4775879-Lingulodinium_polyedra.AAC.1
MSCPWTLHGLSMASRWIAHGVSMGKPMSNPWIVRAQSMYHHMDSAWASHGLSMGSPWPWTVHGQYMDSP